MAKVKKTSDYEMLVQFEEIFEDNSVESATMKAETQKVPSEFAQVKITDSKFNKYRRQCSRSGFNKCKIQRPLPIKQSICGLYWCRIRHRYFNKL